MSTQADLTRAHRNHVISLQGTTEQVYRGLHYVPATEKVGKAIGLAAQLIAVLQDVQQQLFKEEFTAREEGR